MNETEEVTQLTFVKGTMGRWKLYNYLPTDYKIFNYNVSVAYLYCFTNKPRHSTPDELTGIGIIYIRSIKKCLNLF